MKLKKNDKVIVTTGRDKGREGSVERLYVKQGKVVVEGVNMYKRHIRKNEQLPDGGIIDLPRAIDVSKIAIVCPKCKKPTRIGYKLEGTKKTRICRKCNAAL